MRSGKTDDARFQLEHSPRELANGNGFFGPKAADTLGDFGAGKHGLMGVGVRKGAASAGWVEIRHACGLEECSVREMGEILMEWKKFVKNY